MLFQKNRNRKVSTKTTNHWFRPILDRLEDRCVPTTFTVANLDDAGAGSFRQAIIGANASPGVDDIDFTTTGVITLASALPAITDTVDINALSGTGTIPTVEVNASGFAGLQFASGSSGSSLKGLALVGAAGNGITLDDSNITIANNYVGVRLDGVTVLANTGDGIHINSTSKNNVIGDVDPVQGVNYATTTQAGSWTGIREGDVSNTFLITGTSLDFSQGVLFEGTIGGTGTYQTFSVPGSSATTIYGPNNLPGANVQLVGTFKNADASTAAVTVNGFLYEGSTSGNGTYTTLNYPGAKYNYIHSTMGGLAVGNNDSATQNGLPFGPGNAFLYNIATQTFTDIVFPGAQSNTVYGIWHNGGTSYTVCGGYSLNAVNNLLDPNRTPLGTAFLADYDALTGQFSNWTSFNYHNEVGQVNFVTHFEGISSVENGVYTLSADSVQINTTGPAQGSFVTVRRNPAGDFSTAVWVDLDYTPAASGQIVTSANSVVGNQVVGQVFTSSGSFPFQSTVVEEFQLSNIISGNGGDGIEINGSSGNRVGMNHIGPSLDGTLDKGNGGNGILITNGSTLNIIGGQATGGNDPTAGVYIRPPMGNLISGNDANGVLIDGLSTANSLSGNFIGTTATGNSALANALDGVAIDNADQNALLGTTFQQSPFVFYNVISGNGSNGIRITNSDNVIVHANFTGVGANNSTIVANKGNGILVEGNSLYTQVGGVIPLGNVCAGNDLNGIEVKDTASGFVTFNTFAGLYAFGNAAPNQLDGILISSTGGNNLLRTNVASGNTGNGIHITGNAQGVTVDPNIAGLITNGVGGILANGKNGLLIDGDAHDNTIGGTLQSVIPQNTFSGNGEYGIAISGTAHDNTIFNTYVGLDVTGQTAYGNTKGGIFLGTGTFHNTIGGTDSSLPNYISSNKGNGIELSGTSDNTIQNNRIGLDINSDPKPNLGNGISISSSSTNKIGVGSNVNTIANNLLAGVRVQSGTRNEILGNSIFDNQSAGIILNSGANGNQPAPTLASAQATSPTTIQVNGVLTAGASSTYQVQLFANTPTTATIQGKNLLGSIFVTTNASGVGNFTFTYTATTELGDAITATATDVSGNTSAFSSAVTLVNSPIFAVGAGLNEAPVVNVYNSQTQSLLFSFQAYDSGFTGGVRVAVADLDANGIPEILAFPGPGGGPNVRVFDSISGAPISGPLSSFMAYDTGFSGGVFGAVGDVDGDGVLDIITGAGAGGGPHVKVFSGSNGAVLQSFFAYSAAFTGGVSVASGDINGDSNSDIITGAGAGGGPQVNVFSGDDGALLRSFFAFDSAFTGGAFVACGNLDSDSLADLIVGAGAGGGPNVRIFSGLDNALLESFFAFDEAFAGGVSVGTTITNAPGLVNILVGAGAGGGPEVQILDGSSFAVIDAFFAFDEDLTGGVWVGGRR